MTFVRLAASWSGLAAGGGDRGAGVLFGLDVGEALLKATGVPPGSALAHGLTCIDFETAARRYGKVGGFAHLATLVKRLRASRPGALLLDGGDTWQGSATALWTNAQDMVDAGKLLGVDVMTGHWVFTLLIKGADSPKASGGIYRPQQKSPGGAPPRPPPLTRGLTTVAPAKAPTSARPASVRTA